MKRPWLWLVCLLLSVTQVGWAQADATSAIAERSTPELLRIGALLYERRECFSSRYLFQQVLEREPDNLDALSGKGQALVCEGEFSEGISALEEVTAAAPRRAEAFVELANAYLEQYESGPEIYEGRLQNALDVLREAETKGASSAAVSNLRGVVLYRQDKLVAARAALLKATEQEPEVADYHHNLGLVQLELGDTEAAVATLRRAVSLEPDSATARNQLGSAYLLLGRCEDAVFELEQATTLAPDQAAVHFNLGRAQFECNEFEAARSSFEKVVALEPTAFAPAYTYLARLELEARNFDRAVTQAAKAALLRPDAEAYYWLGEAYRERSGTASDGSPDSDKAREAFERALEFDATYAPAREALQTP